MKLAIIIPTLNEEKAIGKVIKDFQEVLSQSSMGEIIVYDGNSSDRTQEIAFNLGATVMLQEGKGKGTAVREAFKKIEADVYLMIDGDGTYPVGYSADIIKPIIEERADMVMGVRMLEKGSMKPLHRFGNFLINKTINFLFDFHVSDVTTGYRAFSRDFVKNIELVSGGFQIETEMTIRAFLDGFKVKEIPVPYYRRLPGSEPKLTSFKHGFTIFATIFSMRLKG